MKMNKKIFIHLGPHKTGSTAIQAALQENSALLSKNSIRFLHDAKTHNAAISLAREDYEVAESQIKEISRLISDIQESCVILSQEDFSGELIGRSRRRQVYPKLTKNMRILSRSLRPHHVRFIFFKRTEEDWLRSCYNQHLKFRTRFSDFSDFSDFYGEDFSWDSKLQKPRETFAKDLIEFPYSPSPASGIEKILSATGDGIDMDAIQKRSIIRNSSPTAETLKMLERVNALSEFKDTAWFSKKLIMDGWKPNMTVSKSEPFKKWPPKTSSSYPCALPSLKERVEKRVDRHTPEDLLPDTGIDLHKLAFEYLPKEAELPDGPRSNMQNQYSILEYHLRGKSRLAHLNAMVISYLRRDTPFTEKARTLFHKIWREQGILLLNELSTRWLISTLQTFLDHGENEYQRKIGATGYFYGNVMKIYEGERSLEGLE